MSNKPIQFDYSCTSGKTVRFTTIFNEEKQGEVIACDCNKEILLLKRTSSSRKPELNNISLINLKHVESIEVVKEKGNPLPPLPAINTSKLLSRFKEEISHKRCLAKARSNGVSNVGIHLYKFLKKVMPVNAVCWSEQSISIMDEVLIKFPYRSEDCVLTDSATENVQCLNHVRKTVERFHKEEKSKWIQQEST